MRQFINEQGRILTLIVLVVISVGLLGLSYQLHYRGRFYPGVVLGGEAVGGMAYGDVVKLFKNRVDMLSDKGFALVFENTKSQKEIKIPAFVSGLTTDSSLSYFSFGDWKGATWQAYEFGRTGGPWRRIPEQLYALVFGRHLDMPGTPNKWAIQSLLFRELMGFFKSPAQTQFTWNGYRMVITPGKAGQRLSIDYVMAMMQKRLVSFATEPIQIKPTLEEPQVTAEKLKPFLQLANDVAQNTSMVFYFREGRWRIAGRTLASWLTLKKQDEIGINREKLEAFLSKNIAPSIDDPPRNSRFEMQNGKLVEIISGKPGNVVDVEKTVARVERVVYRTQGSYMATGNLLFALTSAAAQETLHLEKGNVEIPVEITQEAPKITQATIDQYGIKELVGSAKTSFKGSSADRKHNIEVGVSNLSGVLLAPGEEFSAVKAIGTTTEEEGFVKEFVIKDNKSVKELGGGLCQVATTLFRLALDTGLPITDRTPHRYVVSYYGPGLDATIYGPEPDLRFINDTGNYLLLQGKVEGNEVTFELYGQRDGRLAQVSDPVLTNEIPAPDIKYVASPDLPIGQTQCSETPHKGITADVTYDVHYATGETKEQRFHSVYQPWQRICLVGTGQ